MSRSRADPPKKLLQIKNNSINVDNHNLLRRLTREISVNKGSMEDYYHEEVPVSVPFRWESEPGTPKFRLRDSPLPPLTPPPSYYHNSPKSPIRKNPNPNPNTNTKSNNLLGAVFTKRATKKKSSNPSLPSSSSSSSSSTSSSRSSSYSVPSSPMMRASNFQGRYEMSSPRLSYDSRACYEEEDEYESHNNVSSALRFSGSANARPRGWYSYLIKMLLKNP